MKLPKEIEAYLPMTDVVFELIVRDCARVAWDRSNKPYDEADGIHQDILARYGLEDK